jgi:RNA polymerase sigma-70 factor (ECF subfamily)
MKEITLEIGQTPILVRTGVGNRRVRHSYDLRKASPLKTKRRPTTVPSMTPPPPPPQPDPPPQPGRDREKLQATLKLAAAGEESAWRELVDTYASRVYGLIRAQCSNTDLAEEITQSTFCTVVAKIASYTELGKFEQWLFRIAMNRLRDEMRRRKRQARPVEDDSLAGMAGPSREGRDESPMSDPAEFRALRDAVAQLSDADQQIIHLRHYGGLSFKQIAEILDQPLGTVLARQHRALKKLNELLGGAADWQHD